ncbi:hypothetical protein ACHAWO_011832 [Cyclotella atomus]|uniref:Uncharacterized protein n=1 Tax=Cyclotella atomus TaxID=382360 RepID=A0ABD3PMU6_9STRA
MKLFITITAALFSSAVAFAPSASTRTLIASSQSQQTVLFAEPKEEEEGLDLNLEEMFDMFDAADKGQDFDKAIKDVKKEKSD